MTPLFLLYSALSVSSQTLFVTQDQLDTLTEEIDELREAYELAKNAATNYISSAEDTLGAARQLKDAVSNIQFECSFDPK